MLSTRTNVEHRQTRTEVVWRWALALPLGLVLSVCGTARAEEPEANPLAQKVTEFTAKVAQHVKENAGSDLLADARRGVDLHKETAADAALQRQVWAALENVFRGVQPEERSKVLDVIVATADPQVAKLVKPLLKQSDTKASSGLLLSAIQAASKVPAADNVEPLLKLVEDSKHMGVAAAALQALGAFGSIKAKRVKVLETLTKTVQKAQPGGPPGSRGSGSAIDGTPPPPPSTSGDAAARWAALSPLLPKALNALTGQAVSDAHQWFRLVKETRDLQDLFSD